MPISREVVRISTATISTRPIDLAGLSAHPPGLPFPSPKFDGQFCFTKLRKPRLERSEGCLLHLLLHSSSEKVSPSADSGKRLPCLSDGLKFHLIAQTGELANEAFLRSFTIPFFKEGFPFLQIGGLVTEKVIDNDQDTVSDGDSSSFGPATFGDSAILLSQIALLLMRGRMSSLHEQAS